MKFEKRSFIILRATSLIFGALYGICILIKIFSFDFNLPIISNEVCLDIFINLFLTLSGGSLITCITVYFQYKNSGNKAFEKFIDISQDMISVILHYYVNFDFSNCIHNKTIENTSKEYIINKFIDIIKHARSTDKRVLNKKIKFFERLINAHYNANRLNKDILNKNRQFRDRYEHNIQLLNNFRSNMNTLDMAYSDIKYSRLNSRLKQYIDVLYSYFDLLHKLTDCCTYYIIGSGEGCFGELHKAIYLQRVFIVFIERYYGRYYHTRENIAFQYTIENIFTQVREYYSKRQKLDRIEVFDGQEIKSMIYKHEPQIIEDILHREIKANAKQKEELQLIKDEFDRCFIASKSDDDIQSIIHREEVLLKDMHIDMHNIDEENLQYLLRNRYIHKASNGYELTDKAIYRQWYKEFI